jgi:regulator of protease activity HflC (stomatin/prohibitin superfamily)
MAHDRFEGEPLKDPAAEAGSHKGPGKTGGRGDPLSAALKELRGRLLPTKSAMNILTWTGLGLFFAIGGLTSVRYVGPNEVGVRTNEFTIPFVAKRGIEPVPYGPGLHIVPPFISHMNTLSTQLQKVTMSSEVDVDGFGNDELRFRTRDGNDIKLNVDFTFRVNAAKAPLVVQYVGQDMDEIIEKFRHMGRSAGRDDFGTLSSESFYATMERNVQIARTEENLKAALEPYGITFLSVNTHNFDWANPAYRLAIDDKIDADAETEQLGAQITRQVSENEKLVAAQQAIVNRQMEQADGLYEQKVREVDGLYTRADTLAIAIIQEGRNEAAAIRAKRLAMNSQGGRTQVMMDIAAALSGKPVYQLPTPAGGAIQTFDLNAFLTLSGLDQLMKAASPAGGGEGG